MKYIYGLLLIFVILFVACSSTVIQTGEEKELEEIVEDDDNPMLSVFVSNLRSGGPGKDGIPAIEEPEFVNVSDAEEFIEDKEPVFLVDYNGIVRIYPQNILVWHEIVNDKFEEEHLSITYCPLTGSAVGYKGRIGEVNTDYGVSGMLLNSNLVMYDRGTDTYIPQILGLGLNQDLRNHKFETFPVIWTRWELAKVKYPQAQVLSQDTGYFRNYERDPYGSYLEEDNYYDNGAVLFPVMNSDQRIENNKEVVIGVRGKNSQVAILKSKLVEEKVANVDFGDEKVVAIYDESLDTVRVFERNGLDFSFSEGQVIDNNGNQWSVLGKSDSESLIWVDSFDVMWFAWVAYFPETSTYQ